jgi:hypothetical protein
MSRDERWLKSELPDELERILRNVQASPPAGDRLARMRANLGAAIGAEFSNPQQPGGAPTHAAPAPAARFVSLGKPIGLGMLVVLGLGALWWNHNLSRDASQLSAANESQHTVNTAPPSAADQTSPQLAPTDRAPESNTAPPTPLPPSAAIEPRSIETRPSARRELGLAEELRQLERIRREVARSPKRALLDADAHRQRFPHGALGPERELLRIEALLRLGQSDRAEQLAATVLSAPESNPYHAQVADLMARYPKRSDSLTDLPR